MGIGLQAQNAAIDAIKAQFVGANKRLRKMRVQAGAAHARLTEWIAKLDAALNAAPEGFALDKPAQFDTFVDALPDPVLDHNPSDPPNAQTLV